MVNTQRICFYHQNVPLRGVAKSGAIQTDARQKEKWL
jgi:hypothetical protein